MTIDDRPVIGFWEGDDAVVIERNTDLGTPLTGADGASVVSMTADQSANVTLKLMANSAMNQYLAQKVKLMRAGSQKLISIAVRDTSTGEGGGCTAAVIIKEPSVSLGASASEREWVFFCNCWQTNDITYAPAA
ncbi:phage structural protein [Alsobacter sp. KACC 23698]